jgi:hypothetical protein
MTIEWHDVFLMTSYYKHVKIRLEHLQKWNPRMIAGRDVHVSYFLQRNTLDV